jgi:hypothetical protein
VTYGGTSGTEVALVSMTVSGESWEYAYTWNGGNVADIIYKVNGRSVLKTVYSYDGSGFLLTIKLYENSTAGTGTPVWGTPIQAARYSYSPGLPILRHVVPPAEYRQMVNNGIDPDTATTTQLDEYAETEYDYMGGGDSRIATMRTHGRRYRYDFAYSSSLHTGNWFNVWRSKTEVTKPGEVVETFYFNGAGEVMLKRIEQKSGSTVLKTWYPVYQQFESGGGARIVLSAGGTAIASVSESAPGLATLVNRGEDPRIFLQQRRPSGLRDAAERSRRNGQQDPRVHLRVRPWQRPADGERNGLPQRGGQRPDHHQLRLRLARHDQPDQQPHDHAPYGDDLGERPGPDGHPGGELRFDGLPRQHR